MKFPSYLYTRTVADLPIVVLVFRKKKELILNYSIILFWSDFRIPKYFFAYF